MNIEIKGREGEKSTSWKSRLEIKRVLIADGGWGTEFVQRGLGPGEAPEAWNLERRRMSWRWRIPMCRPEPRSSLPIPLAAPG